MISDTGKQGILCLKIRLCSQRRAGNFTYGSNDIIGRMTSLTHVQIRGQEFVSAYQQQARYQKTGLEAGRNIRGEGVK